MKRAIAAVLSAVVVIGPAAAQNRPAVVSDEAFRVCGDPANLPYSNRAEEGFENKIARLVADELNQPLRYFWMPTGPGFVRNTLGTKLCDVIIGYAAGADIVQNTNAYYRSSYVIVTKPGGPLDGIDQLSDERLKGRKIGLVAATPPTDYLLRFGLLATAKTYPLVVDRRYDSPSDAMIADLVSGEVDAALMWGPNGGYFAKKSGVPLTVTPLLKEKDGPPMSFRITFGIRVGEIEWKRKLNELITKKQGAIDRILLDYGVPLVDDLDRPITKPRG